MRSVETRARIIMWFGSVVVEPVGLRSTRGGFDSRSTHCKFFQPRVFNIPQWDIVFAIPKFQGELPQRGW